MQLFHGSNVAVENPQLVEQMRGLDFGAGFYLTTEEKQAIRFSKIIFNRRKSGVPTVSVYDLDMETAEQSLIICRYKSADAEWLRFVTENRLKKYHGSVYDIVIGAVANDTLMPTIQAFVGGFINEEAVIITLKASKLVDQICLKSDKALSLLRYLKSYDTSGD